ncbi:MAG: hypothetical protein CVU95_06405 [Firmicutes bacterium HGW-Firmicutes-2]|nr:MAG: hypothetical protein CVU95_06405 [Firmicutes bacterium HGW-Firmicutes-2]
MRHKMKLLNYILINKEARLFDTKEFLLKAFVAVLIGSFVGESIPYVSKDMISVLFGMMLTLEPVNLTGIRSGFKQVEASVIGALITGLILSLLGYNPWSAALSVTVTLYVSLLINWREFSVVAVFTSIYMAQYVQLDLLGNPSEIETFKLRITALITGVAIAMFVNLLFSFMGYKHMMEKRVFHLLEQISKKTNAIYQMLSLHNYEDTHKIMKDYGDLFNNLNWINGTILDYQKDFFTFKNEQKSVKLEKIIKMTELLREMSHITYDICFRLSKGDHGYKEPEFVECFEHILHRMDQLLEKLNCIIHNRDVTSVIVVGSRDKSHETLKLLNENIEHMDHLLTHYL